MRDGEVGKKRIGLKHHTNIALVRLQTDDLFAVNANIANGRSLKSGDHAKHSGLAAAGGAKQRDEFALVDVETEILDHFVRAE